MVLIKKTWPYCRWKVVSLKEFDPSNLVLQEGRVAIKCAPLVFLMLVKWREYGVKET